MTFVVLSMIFVVLKVYIIVIIGFFICVVGDKYLSVVKSVILELFGVLINKGGIALKLFVS